MSEKSGTSSPDIITSINISGVAYSVLVSTSFKYLVGIDLSIELGEIVSFNVFNSVCLSSKLELYWFKRFSASVISPDILTNSSLIEFNSDVNVEYSSDASESNLSASKYGSPSGSSSGTVLWESSNSKIWFCFSS